MSNRKGGDLEYRDTIRSLGRNSWHSGWASLYDHGWRGAGWRRDLLFALIMLPGKLLIAWGKSKYNPLNIIINFFREVGGKPPVKEYSQYRQEVLSPTPNQLPEARKELNSPGKMDEIGFRKSN
jgi:hypothetical protein